MRGFVWPEWIKFDDSEEDIKEARRLWLAALGIEQSCGSAGEFLDFMQAYTDQLEIRRAQEELARSIRYA